MIALRQSPNIFQRKHGDVIYIADRRPSGPRGRRFKHQWSLMAANVGSGLGPDLDTRIGPLAVPLRIRREAIAYFQQIDNPTQGGTHAMSELLSEGVKQMRDLNASLTHMLVRFRQMMPDILVPGVTMPEIQRAIEQSDNPTLKSLCESSAILHGVPNGAHSLGNLLFQIVLMEDMTRRFVDMLDEQARS